MDLNGTYTSNGRLILIPIRGKGDYNITLIKPTANYRILGKIEKANDGMEYVNLTQLRVHYNGTEGIVKFENLLGNDPVIAQTIDRFLSENFFLIFDQFHDTLFDVISNMTREIIQNIFNKIPYDDFFLKP